MKDMQGKGFDPSEKLAASERMAALKAKASLTPAERAELEKLTARFTQKGSS